MAVWRTLAISSVPSVGRACFHRIRTGLSLTGAEALLGAQTLLDEKPVWHLERIQPITQKPWWRVAVHGFELPEEKVEDVLASKGKLLPAEEAKQKQRQQAEDEAKGQEQVTAGKDRSAIPRKLREKREGARHDRALDARKKGISESARAAQLMAESDRVTQLVATRKIQENSTWWTMEEYRTADPEWVATKLQAEAFGVAKEKSPVAKHVGEDLPDIHPSGGGAYAEPETEAQPYSEGVVTEMDMMENFGVRSPPQHEAMYKGFQFEEERLTSMKRFKARDTIAQGFGPLGRAAVAALRGHFH